MESKEFDKICVLERNKLSASVDLREIEDRMHVIEAEVAIAVEAEWEETKDKSLSNAQKRTIEIERRLAQNQDYQNLREAKKAISLSISQMRIDIDYLRRAHYTDLCNRLCDTFGWVGEVLNGVDIGASENEVPGAPPRTGGV